MEAVSGGKANVPQRSVAFAYGLALAALGAAVLLRWLLDPLMGDTLPLVTLFGAVAVAVWLGGYRPALLVVALGYVACAYLFIASRSGLGLGEGRNLVGAFAYLVTCSIIIGFGEAMRVSQRRFEELVRQQEQLSSPTPASIESIRRKHSLRDVTVIGFGLTLAVLIVGGELGYLNVGRIARNEQEIAHTHEVTEELEALLSTLKDAETGQRGYLLTENDKYLQPCEDALGRLHAIVAHLKELTSDNTDQQARLGMLESKITVRVDELRQTVALMKGGDRPAALQIVRSDTGKAMMDDLREQVVSMQQAEEDLLRRRVADSAASSRTAVVSNLLTAVIGTVLVCVVFSLSQRNVIIRQRAAEVLARQEERLRVTLDSIGDAVIATDAGGNVTYLNAVAQALTGWTAQQANGQPLATVFQIIHEQTRQPAEDPVEKVLKQGKIVGLANHTVLIGKDGTERPIEDSAAPISDGVGAVTGVVLVFRDITERRKAEREQRNSEQRFHTVIQQVKDYAIFITDPQGRATSWNEGVKRVLGFDEAEFVGKDISKAIFTPEDVQSGVPQRELDQAAARETANNDRWMLKKDGTRFFAMGVTSALRDETGQLVGFTKVMRDQTEQKRLEEELRQAAADLSEADRRKNEFLATLAHELRNPLAPLRNGLQILRLTGHSRESVDKARTMMERQLGQMVRLIDDLLDLSRITQGKIELRKERVPLAAVVQQAVETSRPAVEQAEHELTIRIPPDPIYVDADVTRLCQVFSNLLNNAAKFTPKGGHVWLAVERRGGEAVVTVRDTGVGIPAPMLPRVFDLFTQVDRSLERSQGGLGIGLTIVKRLVEMHGGSIEARSDGQSMGSEFVVCLPVVLALVGGQPPDEAEAIRPAARRRILVVDDNRDSATSLAMLLGIMGNETQTAYDGLEALDVAAEFRPDVVLLDIGMPKLDGYDVCRRIRQEPWGTSVVLVALTGWSQEEDKQRSREAGFSFHLVKPVDPAVLEKLLDGLRIETG